MCRIHICRCSWFDGGQREWASHRCEELGWPRKQPDSWTIGIAEYVIGALNSIPKKVHCTVRPNELTRMRWEPIYAVFEAVLTGLSIARQKRSTLALELYILNILQTFELGKLSRKYEKAINMKHFSLVIEEKQHKNISIIQKKIREKVFFTNF